MDAKDSKNQQKKAGKANDPNALYEKMKDFKTKFPEATDNDEFFKGLYSRLRKYTKKLNKLAEVKDKNQDSKEDKENIKKKKELELTMDEMTAIIGEYIKHFDNHCEQIWSMKKASPQEQVEAHEEEEDVEEQEPEPVETQPQVDIEAIRVEEYQKGFEKGRNAGYEDGKAEGYTQGKNDGYSQAQLENQAKDESNNVEQIQKAIKYASLISIMACWIDSFTPMEPAFKRNDYFTDDECNAIRKLYFSIHTIQPHINFNALVSENTNRISKLVSKNEENLLNTPNVTYKSLAETFDRVLENHKFIQTTHQMLPAMQDFNMGMYAQMQGTVPGQIITQSPSMTAAAQTTASVSQTPVEVKQTETKQESQKVEQKTAFIAEEQKHESKVESHQKQELGQTFQVNTVEEVNWNDHDDHDDDDDDHEDSDSNEDDENEVEDHNKENQDFGVPEEVQGTPESQEAQEQTNQENKPYNKRGGGYRGRGSRGGRYGYNRGYNNYYNQRGYQGQNRGQRRGGRYRENRGGRGKYNDYYGGGGGYYEHQQNYQEYPEDYKEEKPAEPEPKMDDDGFELVKEKTYNMNKKKGRKPKKN